MYCIAYFNSLKIYSYSAPWLVVNMQLKEKANHLVNVLHKYEVWQNLFAFARELGFAVSAVNTTMIYAYCIREHAKVPALMKSMIITNEMENILIK
jgi:hypothetical protein